MASTTRRGTEAVRQLAKRHTVQDVVTQLLWPPREESAYVDDILAGAHAAGIEVDRRALVHFLKDLERLRYGRFVAGRRGHRSRFEWAVEVVEDSVSGGTSTPSSTGRSAG
jgi:hypothetical protein